MTPDFHQALLDHVQHAVIATDCAGRIIYWNRSAERLYQWTSAEVLGRSIFDVTVPPEERDAAATIVAALGRGESWDGEFRVRRKDGSTFPAHVTDSPLRDTQGALIGYVGVSVDLSERKAAEAELRASEQRFARIFRASPIAIGYTSVRSGRVIDINEHHTHLFGHTREEVVGRTWRQLGWWSNSADRGTALQLLEANGRLENFETRFRRKSGEEFAGLVSMVQVPLGDEAVVIVMVLDLTERKRTEAELRSSGEQLRALAARLGAVREEEARRIARELHDELGQQLTALKMELVLTTNDAGEAEAQASSFRRMRALIDRTIESVQKISGEIRLGQLDRLGLAAAIEVELAEFQMRTALDCDVSGVTEVGAVARETATGLFRIFQEALTNIARHARARRVKVDLHREGDSLVLIVRDDGRGITAVESAATASLGLLGMRERAQALGGEFQIAALANGGTTVCVRVPDKPSLHA